MTECATTDPVITVTLSWGEDDTLEIGPDCPDSEGVWWNQLTLPPWTYRSTFAPPSQWMPGQVLLAVVPDVASLAMTVAALGTDTDGLQTQKALVEEAFSQWPYTVTITVDDGGGADPVDVGVWAGFPTIPNWGELTTTQAGLFVAEGAIVATLNPTGAP